MVETKSRRKVLLALAVVVTIAAIAVSMVVLPTLAAPTQNEDKKFAANAENWSDLESSLNTEDAVAPQKIANVTVEAKGFAFQRIDNKTIKQYPTELNMTVEIGDKEGEVIAVANASGTVTVNGMVYTIQSGKGLIRTGRNVALIHCECVDASGESILLGIRVRYFWWGGKLYALRVQALLRTTEHPTLLLMRGIAKIQ